MLTAGKATIPFQTRENVEISKEVAQVLYDIDPNQRERPYRSGEWIKKQFADLRTRVQVIWHNYSRSGNQAGDVESKEGIDDWVHNFCRGGQVLQYAILVWDKSILSGLGRLMPEGTGYDSGIIDADGKQENLPKKTCS